MATRPGIAGALVASVTLVACRAPTQITVSVQTNVQCAEVSATSFTAGELGAIETAAETSESNSCAGMHLGTVVLVPSGADNAEVGFKVVTALNHESLATCSGAAGANDVNCIVARRQLRYLPHTPLTVIVNMTKQCEGQVCDATSTCVNGVCENATVDPTQCEGAGCDESVLTPESSDAGVDATLGDATVDATLDSPSEAEPGEASVPDAAAGVPGCDLRGLQAASPWPMEGYCPSGRYRSPLVGPGASVEHKWGWVGPFAETSPSVAADGTLYYASMAGVVTALSPSDGGVLWTYSPNGDASVYRTLPVVAADDTLRFLDWVNGDYVVLGLDASLQANVNMGHAGRGSLTIAGDGTIYFSDDSSNLVAMTPDGVVKWMIPDFADGFLYPAVGSDGTIFSATTALGDSTSSTGVGASHPDGGPAWASIVDGGPYATSPVVAVDGTLRVGATNNDNAAPGVLYKLDPSSGAVIWSKVVDPQGIVALSVGDDGTTYVSGSNAITSWDSSGTRTGSLPHSCNQATIDPDGNVYAVCDYGILMSFDPGLTVVRWQIAIPSFLGGVNDAVIIGKGNMLYVATNDDSSQGAVDAFGPK